MSETEKRASVSKRVVPLSLVGKIIRLVMNLGWLTLSAWMLLLLVVVMSDIFWRLLWIEKLRSILLSMTSHVWSDADSLQFLLHAAHSLNLPIWLAWAFPNIDALEGGTKFFQPWFALSLLVTQLIFLRCQIFLLGTPLLLSFACLGFLDGLVQRDIRKYRGTRESSLFFHRSKAFLNGFFYSSYFMFLILPFAFDVHGALCMIAMITGWLIYVSSEHFKKYI